MYILFSKILPKIISTYDSMKTYISKVEYLIQYILNRMRNTLALYECVRIFEWGTRVLNDIDVNLRQNITHFSRVENPSFSIISIELLLNKRIQGRIPQLLTYGWNLYNIRGGWLFFQKTDLRKFPTSIVPDVTLFFINFVQRLAFFFKLDDKFHDVVTFSIK